MYICYTAPLHHLRFNCVSVLTIVCVCWCAGGGGDSEEDEMPADIMGIEDDHSDDSVESDEGNNLPDLISPIINNHSVHRFINKNV